MKHLTLVSLCALCVALASAQIKKVPTYTISGQASNSALIYLTGPTQNRPVSPSGKPATFQFIGLTAGTYTVRPDEHNCTFQPPEQTVTITNSNVTGINFTSHCTPPKKGPDKKEIGEYTMTRQQALLLLLVSALLLMPAAAETKKQIAFTDYLNGQYGVQHEGGPGTYSFSVGGTLPLIVKNSGKLSQSLGIRNLPNGEHILLRHIKDDRFELRHEATGQKASLRLALKK